MAKSDTPRAESWRTLSTTLDFEPGVRVELLRKYGTRAGAEAALAKSASLWLDPFVSAAASTKAAEVERKRIAAEKRTQDAQIRRQKALEEKTHRQDIRAKQRSQKRVEDAAAKLSAEELQAALEAAKAGGGGA